MNLKNKVLTLGILCALGLPQAAGAEGFAINEWSAEGVAMGGARMFAEGDAANVAYNPASITKVDGEAFKVSATYLSPHGEYDLYDADGTKLDSGTNRVHFGFAPGTYYVKKINDKDWFGIGAFSRFAMVSEFERGSAVSTNAFVSRLDGVSITPTFAHKFDDKWTAAVGAEVNYVRLTMEKNLIRNSPTHTKGESYALGWNAAANYAFDDKNEIGVVYRSRIKHSMEADFNAYNVPITINGQVAGFTDLSGDAYGEVTLPESWHIGYSHKFNDRTRVELNAVRTGWDTYDALNITTPLGLSKNPKNWEDGWRYAIGVEHKLSDKYTLMAGFAYDESSIPYNGGDFMVPTGNRRTYSIGARYNDKDQTVALALGWMDVGDLRFAFTDAADKDGYKGRHAHTHDSFTKIIGISYQRNF